MSSNLPNPPAPRLSLLLALSLAGAAAGAALGGCQEYGVPAGTGPHYEFNFLDMGDQPKIKAQRGDLLGGPDFMPAEGSIPRGFDPYPYHGQPELAAQKLVNPLPHDDPKVFERGKVMFERYCVPCHGDKAAGDGTVVNKGFPAPPSLMTAKLRGWTDGRIYHVISEGQNIMPSYASQVRREDRWYVIRYLRKLQLEEPVAPAAPEPAAPAASASAAPPASGSAAPPASGSALPPASGSAPPAASASAPAAPQTSAAPQPTERR